TAFLPEWDFDGNPLQELDEIEHFHPICFSAWAAGSDACVIFCWHATADHICAPFIDSLRRIPENQMANRILAMAFEYSETVIFNEDWWESRKESDRQIIVHHVPSGAGPGPLMRTASSLLDEGLTALD